MPMRMVMRAVIVAGRVRRRFGLDIGAPLRVERGLHAHDAAAKLLAPYPR